MTDKTLQARVEDELDWEPSIDSSNIGVAVHAGVVRLSGSVRTYPQKIAAEKAAQRVKGVRGVALDIDVRPFGDTGTSDDEVAKRALNTLAWHAMLPGNALKVRVENGHVTLTGELDWQYQREAAERAVQKLYGVRSVINQITLKPQVLASNVKRRIEDALERQARIEAGQVHVSIEGGKVKLDGKVDSWSDRNAVERAAWAAPGVTAVEDRVVIAA